MNSVPISDFTGDSVDSAIQVHNQRFSGFHVFLVDFACRGMNHLICGIAIFLDELIPAKFFVSGGQPFFSFKIIFIPTGYQFGLHGLHGFGDFLDPEVFFLLGFGQTILPSVQDTDFFFQNLLGVFNGFFGIFPITDFPIQIIVVPVGQDGVFSGEVNPLGNQRFPALQFPCRLLDKGCFPLGNGFFSLLNFNQQILNFHDNLPFYALNGCLSMIRIHPLSA